MVPLLLSVLVVLSTALVAWDFRILYFRKLPPKPTKTEWIQDFQFLKTQMVERHADLSACVSEAELDEALRTIENRIDGLSESQIVMELFRFTAMLNDAHTFPFIMIPCFDLHVLPIVMYGFDDGWCVVNAGRGQRDLIGSRIVAIGSKSMQEIETSVPLLLSAESEFGRRQRFPYMCTMVEWLAYHGIIQDTRSVALTLETPEGDTVVRRLVPVPFYPQFLWSSVFEIDNERPAVFSNPRKDFYRFAYLEPDRAMYVKFNQCVDQPGRETMDAFVSRMAAFAQQRDISRWVVDLRNNDGGNRVWDALLEFLRDRPEINRQGGLFVLIGRRTFSSAVLFADQLQMQTEATFVGEPTGQGPVFFGNPSLVELPNSRLMFAISSHLARSGLPFDSRDSIEPDLPRWPSLAGRRHCGHRGPRTTPKRCDAAHRATTHGQRLDRRREKGFGFVGSTAVISWGEPALPSVRTELRSVTVSGTNFAPVAFLFCSLARVYRLCG